MLHSSEWNGSQITGSGEEPAAMTDGQSVSLVRFEIEPIGLANG